MTTPRATDPTRWDNELPVYLDDYMNVYNKRDKGAQKWEVDVVLEIYPRLQEIVLDHMRRSSKSRIAFSSMPREHYMDSEGRFVFTKRNFAILHPPIAQACEQVVFDTLRGRCLGIQEEILEVLPVILASPDEYSHIEAFFKAADFFFDNLAEHLTEQSYWRNELRRRHPIITVLREREVIIDRLITFEEWKSDPSKFNDRQTTMNEDARFRSEAAQILIRVNKQAIEKLDAYESQVGRPLYVWGRHYRKYLDASVSQSALVKTNFTTLTREPLIMLQHIPQVGTKAQALICTL